MNQPRVAVFAAFCLLMTGAAAAQVAGTGEGRAICNDRYAYTAGILAYLEAELHLSDRQRPAWYKWQQWKMDAAAKERDACLAGMGTDGGDNLTALGREALGEKLLALKLQGMQAARPSLEALYDELTPEQRTMLDHVRKGRRALRAGFDVP